MALADVAIIGAGIGGLTAALSLQRRGVRVRIFEQTKQLGEIGALARLPALCAEGAELLLCLNSPHLETSFLRELVQEYAPQLVFKARLPNPAAFVDENPELSLKVLSYSFPGPSKQASLP